MSDDEVDELLKAVDTSSGEINYTGMYYLQRLFPYKLLLINLNQISFEPFSPTDSFLAYLSSFSVCFRVSKLCIMMHTREHGQTHGRRGRPLVL